MIIGIRIRWIITDNFTRKINHGKWFSHNMIVYWSCNSSLWRRCITLFNSRCYSSRNRCITFIWYQGRNTFCTYNQQITHLRINNFLHADTSHIKSRSRLYAWRDIFASDVLFFLKTIPRLVSLVSLITISFHHFYTFKTFFKVQYLTVLGRSKSVQ